MRRRAPAVAAALLSAGLVLAGCASTDGIAGSYAGGDYTSDDGATTVIAAKNRATPVEYRAATANGTTVSSSQLLGHVVVINFWYAQCGPCIAEAPRLEELYQRFQADGVQFLGVDINDAAPQATAFQNAHGITYPTTLDAQDSPMRLAFAGKVSPTTTPTTLVVDTQGRVAARFSGEITKDQATVLAEVIADTADEKTP